MEKKDITNAELLTAIQENGQAIQKNANAIEKNAQAIQKNTRALQENNVLTKGLIEQVAKNAVGIAMLDSNIAQLPELLSVRNSVDFEHQEKRISALEDTVLNT